eukprot:TRINITY_DN4243_c0_g1_i1.p1 TRINITY_DN4243_c0_g1~~TRINITY_DN4243_c0_g1_i1.p1  ORF type:complete len:337 (-),score=51.88 TRINITY_DN4243_c0_g1_i1:25-945(-)
MSLLDDVARVDKILLEPYDYISKIKGKEIRPQLIEAFNHWIKAPQERVDCIKQIVQKLHNASLLIDDIEDNSRLRRGQPAAHKIYGEATVINTGNFVYFLALQDTLALEKPEAVKVFSDEMVRLHRGQGCDIIWRDTHTCPSEEQYNQMVIDKTGGLFRLAIGLMSAFGSFEHDLHPIVNTLAMFFQILDDYLNLQSQQYFDNKSFCEDLTEGKFSFPIIHSIRATPGDSKLRSILKQRTEDVDIKRYAVRLMEESNSFQYTREKLQGYYNQLQVMVAEFGGNRYLSGIVDQLAASADIKPLSVKE